MGLAQFPLVRASEINIGHQHAPQLAKIRNPRRLRGDLDYGRQRRVLYRTSGEAKLLGKTLAGSPARKRDGLDSGCYQPVAGCPPLEECRTASARRERRAGNILCTLIFDSRRSHTLETLAGRSGRLEDVNRAASLARSCFARLSAAPHQAGFIAINDSTTRADWEVRET